MPKGVPKRLTQAQLDMAAKRFQQCDLSVQYFELARHKAAINFILHTDRPMNKEFTDKKCLERLEYMLIDFTLVDGLPREKDKRPAYLREIVIRLESELVRFITSRGQIEGKTSQLPMEAEVAQPLIVNLPE